MQVNYLNQLWLIDYSTWTTVAQHLYPSIVLCNRDVTHIKKKRECKMAWNTRGAFFLARQSIDLMSSGAQRQLLSETVRLVPDREGLSEEDDTLQTYFLPTSVRWIKVTLGRCRGGSVCQLGRSGCNIGIKLKILSISIGRSIIAVLPGPST